MGFQVGDLRRPLTPMEEENKEKLKKVMQEYGIL